MAGMLDALAIRKRLGRKQWQPPEPFGDDGFLFVSADSDARMFVSPFDLPPELIPGLDAPWIHASVSRGSGLPSYDDLVLMHRAVWDDGHAYQVFVPPSRHINIHPRALHLWGRADGQSVLPDFGRFGTI